MTTPFNLSADPARFADALRQATVAGIDGLLDLQKQVNEAASKTLAQARTESDRLGDKNAAALEETLTANVEIATRALGWYREQVVAFGKAPAAPETPEA